LDIPHLNLSKDNCLTITQGSLLPEWHSHLFICPSLNLGTSFSSSPLQITWSFSSSLPYWPYNTVSSVGAGVGGVSIFASYSQ
jgi:hypothetical protein